MQVYRVWRGDEGERVWCRCLGVHVQIIALFFSIDADDKIVCGILRAHLKQELLALECSTHIKAITLKYHRLSSTSS